MGIFDILHNIKTWFINIINFERQWPVKRKIGDYETINNNSNKRTCLDHSFVSLYNESDTEEKVIIKYGLGNALLKANSPSMLDGIKHKKRSDAEEEEIIEYGLDNVLLKANSPSILDGVKHKKRSDVEEEEIIEYGLDNVLLKANSPSILDGVKHKKRSDVEEEEIIEYGLDNVLLKANSPSIFDSVKHKKRSDAEEEGIIEYGLNNVLLKANSPSIFDGVKHKKRSDAEEGILEYGLDNVLLKANSPSIFDGVKHKKRSDVEEEEIIEYGLDNVLLKANSPLILDGVKHKKRSDAEEEGILEYGLDNVLLKANSPLILDGVKHKKRSDAEEEGILEYGLDNVLLKANSPLILDDIKHQKTIISSKGQTESIDKENSIQVYKPVNLSNQTCILKVNDTENMIKSASSEESVPEDYLLTSSQGTDKQLTSSMEFGLSKLQINNFLINDSYDTILPPSEAKVTPDSGLTSPLNVHNEFGLNQSTHLSQIPEHCFGKDDIEIGESSSQIKDISNDMFYNTLLKKFQESSATITFNSSEIHDKLPEEISQEELDKTNKLPLKAKHVIPNYSTDMVKFVECQMSNPPKNYIVEKKNIRIADLSTVFRLKGWFNDEVINHYFNMITERDQKIHVFSTYFYEQLFKLGYNAVSRWTKRKDIFTYKKILIPIHLKNHWCLVCVDFVYKTVTYYDSLHISNFNCLNKIYNYLKQEHENKKNVEFDCTGWKLIEAQGPSQLNSYDCGAFVCVSAEYLSRDAELDFTQDDMPDLRLKICYEIIVNSLFYTTE